MAHSILFPESEKFHKKKAELQVSLKRPTADATGRITDKGCLFFEMANALNPEDPNTKMDWQNKVTVKIGSADIAKFLRGIKTKQEVKIFHQSTGNTGSSSINFKPGTEGSFQMSMFKKTQGQADKMSSLYLNAEDIELIYLLLCQGYTASKGWS